MIDDNRGPHPQTAVLVLRVCVILLSAGTSVLTAADESTSEVWSYRADLLRPFWQGDVMEGESVLFIRDEQTGVARASLLFPVDEIQDVRNSAGDTIYKAGRDYLWKAGSREITLPAGSLIPSFTLKDLRRPAGSQKYALTHSDGDGEILFGSRLEYHSMQTCFTYRHDNGLWTGPVPEFSAAALPRTVEKLLNKKPLSLVVVGDSISAGCNASGWAGGAPWQPAWPELFRRYLQERFATTAVLTNPSVSGTDTQWVLNMIDKVVEPEPDLVIIAFGMNDAAGRSATEYQSNIRAIMTKIREKQPDCEFILVASMLGNRDWTRLDQKLFPQYRDVLNELRKSGVAVADLTSVWAEFLKYKHDRDQSGNGVNHPNDFGHRVYAQVLATLVTPPPDPIVETEAGVTIKAGPLMLTERVLLSGYTYSYAVAAGDLDGDGDTDLTTADAEPNNSLYLLRNDGKGNFSRSHIQRYAMKSDQPARLERHALGDLNRDGHPDLVIVDNMKWDIRWFRNPGPAHLTDEWSLQRICAPGEVPGAYDVAISDLDADGDPDIAASSWRHGNRFDWFENSGYPGNGLSWSRHEIDSGLSETRTIVTGDFNSDGWPDLLGTARTGHQILWYSNSAKLAALPFQKQVIDDQTQFPAHGHAADMDEDGDQDVIMAFGIAASVDNSSPLSHQVAWYENPHQSSKSRQTGSEQSGSQSAGVWVKHLIAPSFPQGFEAVSGDLDLDGDLDVVATGWSSRGHIAWFENSGNPDGPWLQHVLKTEWANPNTVILSDLDHDGRLDIVACAERGANELRWWKNTGTEKR